MFSKGIKLPSTKTRFLWILFALTLLALAVDVTARALDYKPLEWVRFVKFGLSVFLFVLHALWTLSPMRGFFFIFLSSLTGFFFEVAGVNTGTVFGGQYAYDPVHFGSLVLGVPFLVPLLWFVFIYIGYSITSSFLEWMKLEKPNRKTKSIGSLLLLIAVDILLITSVDMFADPIMIREHAWTWFDGGPYFGVPIGNFTGWLTVCLIVTGTYRTLEYFFPQKKSPLEKKVLLIPLLGYGVTYATFLVGSFMMNLPELALIGTFVMLPVVFLNLFFFVNRRN